MNICVQIFKISLSQSLWFGSFIPCLELYKYVRRLEVAKYFARESSWEGTVARPTWIFLIRNVLNSHMNLWSRGYNSSLTTERYQVWILSQSPKPSSVSFPTININTNPKPLCPLLTINNEKVRRYHLDRSQLLSLVSTLLWSCLCMFL